MRRLSAWFIAGFLLLTGCSVLFDTEPDLSPRETPAIATDPTPTASLSPPPEVTPAPTTTPTPSPTTSPPATPSGGQKARRQLKELRVIDRKPSGIPPYARKEFGSSWSDIDGNGCNQRDDVLLRDAVKGTAKTQWQGRCNHDVIAGTWLDPYTGKKLVFDDLKDLSQARAIQIDHIVPLSEAWRSGAYNWPYELRRQYANTLSNLLAVDGPANQAKGDGDPASWRPRKGHQCTYAKRWIRVKHEWDLGADASEIRALNEMLDYCK